MTKNGLKQVAKDAGCWSERCPRLVKPEVGALWCARTLLGLAALVSAALAFMAMAQGRLAVCGSGCNAVLASQWSQILGIPSALPGLVAYIVLLAFSGRIARGARDPLTNLALALTLIIPGSGLWFTLIQAFVLKAFCPWCCLCHGCGLVAVIALWLARLGGLRRSHAGLGWAQFFRVPLPIAGIALVAFCGAQMLCRDKAPHRAVTLPEPAVAQTDNSAGSTRRPVSLYGDRFQVNAAELPCIGSLDARHLAVGLFDYTCVNCRALHRNLQQLQAASGSNELVTVSLPASRDAGGAEIHRLMLALWRLDSAVHRELSDKLAREEVAATPTDVWRAITNRVNAAAFSQARQLHVAWINSQLDLARLIRLENEKVAHTVGLPQLIAGSQIILGSLPPAPLQAKLSEAFNARSPQRNTPELQLSPSTLVLARSRLHSPTRRAVFVSSSPGRVFAVTNIELPLRLTQAGVEARSRRVSAGYVLDFTFPPGFSASEYHGETVVVRTDQPRFERLELPLLAPSVLSASPENAAQPRLAAIRTDN